MPQAPSLILPDRIRFGADAESLYRRSLAIREKALGPEHRHVALSLNKLAELYQNQGRYAEAEPLYRRSLAIREKALAPEHPHVARTLNDLALLFYNQGKYAEAGILYQQCLAILEKALGPHSPDLVTVLQNYACLLRKADREAQGLCVWFTGLSGAGKTTTAEILSVLLLEHGRHVTLLDGDVVRTNLSRELGFSREDRNTNVRRIGFVASEIVRHGGVAVCAAVSPYRDTRDEIRNMVGPECFFEVFVDTPLETCERRDPKGLYAKARRGEIRGFTGIDDPYEPPLSAEITLGTLVHSAEENARLILDHMVQRGLVREA